MPDTDANGASGELQPAKPAFSMAVKAKKAALTAPAGGFEAAAAPSSAAQEEVTEMVEGKVDADKPPPVISGLKNTFNVATAVIGAGAPAAAPEALTASAPAAASAEGAAVDADAEAMAALLHDAAAVGTSGLAALDDTARYRTDVAMRADAQGADDEAYERLPIEEFGKAYLRGLGWDEGAGVGLNGHGAVEPVEYVARPQLLGLGAAPKPGEGASSGGTNKKFIKPGESREPKKDMIYVDADGRQRHVKKVGEKLVERGPSGFQPGALVAIVRGAHDGLYGRVVSTGGLASELTAALKLTGSGEQVTVSLDEIEPVRDERLERQRKGFTHKQHGGDKEGSGGGRGEGRDGEGGASEAEGEGEGRDDGRGHKRHKEHKKEKKRHRDHREEKKEKKKHRSSHDERRGERGGGLTWVREGLRVRLVDKRLRGGGVYNKKGVVVDVCGPDTFTVRLDDSRALVDDVRTSAVETLVPKSAGGEVMFVLGPHRLRRGTVVERHSSDATAVVQISDSLEVVECGFDDVCEWAGGATAEH